MKLGSTREAIHDALSWGWHQGESSMVQYLTYLTRIEKSIRKSEPCGDVMEAAFICAAINTIGIPGAWIKFAYGPTDLLTVQVGLARQLRDLFPLCGLKRHHRLNSLAMSTLEDMRLSTWNHHRSLPKELYCERIGTKVDHFARDWGEEHKLMIRKVIQWDREGVGQVSRMIHSLRGPTEPEDRPSEILKDIAT